MSIAPVEIDLQANGISEVLRAYETIEQRLIRFEKSITDVHAKEAKAREREQARTLAQITKSAQQAAKDAERAEREKTKATELEARARAKHEEKAQKEATRTATAESKLRAKAEEAAAKEATRANERELRERTKIQERANRERIREMRELDRTEATLRRQALREFERHEHDKTRAMEREFSARKRFADAAGGRVAGSIGSVVSGAGRIAAMAATLGGGVTLANSLGRGLQAEDLAVAVSNSGFNPNAENAANRTRRSKESILSRVTNVQNQYGVDKLELLKGLQSFTARSGDLDTAMQGLPALALLSKATGSNFGELATTAGVLKNQNPNLDNAGMNQMLMSVIAQGKLGAVELPELAKVGGRIASTAARFSGNQAVNQTRMLGLAQIAMLNSASAEDASTGVVRFGADLQKHRKDVEALGIKGAYDKQGAINDPAKLLGQIFEKTGGDMGKIGKIFKDESIKIPLAVSTDYASAYKNATGTEAEKRAAGAAAVTSKLSKFTNATYSRENLADDYKAAANTRSENFNRAVMRLQESIETHAIPYLDRFAAKLPEILPVLERIIVGAAKFADWFLSNPLAGIGAIMAAAVAKDIAIAGIGQIIARAVSAAVMGATGGSAAAGAAGSGAASAASGVAAGAKGSFLARFAPLAGAAGLAALGIGSAIHGVSNALDIKAATEARLGDDGARLDTLASRVSRGTATPEEIAEGKKLSTRVRSEMSNAEHRDLGFGKGSILHAAAGVEWAANQVGLSDSKSLQGASNAATESAVLNKSLGELERALQRLTKASNASADSLSGSPRVEPTDPTRSRPMVKR